MPVHDVTSSTVNLAKSWLMTLDRTKIETSVPTETLRLWLETLIDLGTPQRDVDLGGSAARTVMGRMAAMADKG